MDTISRNNWVRAFSTVTVVYMVSVISLWSATYNPKQLWEIGQTIKVGFDQTVSAEYFDLIESIASTYEHYANINLEFTFDDEVHILIGTDYLDSPWSFVGRRYQRSIFDSKTMNLPIESLYKAIKIFDDSDRAYREFKRIVLHEFGHALGLRHEHQNPLADICWDEEAMNNYCTANGIGCSNYLPLENTEGLKYSVYDRYSIMHYQIGVEPTFCDYKSPYTYNLSTLDKRWINIMYPFSEDFVAEEVVQLGIESIRLEAIDCTDELSFSTGLEVYGEIKLISRKDIDDSCYSDLSNCYAKIHELKYGKTIFHQEKPILLDGEDRDHYEEHLGGIDISPNDEYFIHIDLLEKDVVTSDEQFRYTQGAYEHSEDILIPIDNLFWKGTWSTTYLISESRDVSSSLRMVLEFKKL